MKWDLAWTIASGMVLGKGILSLPSHLERLEEGNWKATGLCAAMIAFSIGVPAFVALGYFKWGWLILGSVMGGLCEKLETRLLTKDQESVS